jgi:intermediate peptidase
MRWVQCDDTRRAIYTAAHAGPEANRGALVGLLEARAEVASLLGFESHAHYTTAPLLAGHPDAVRSLLGDMAARSMDRAGEEMEMMLRHQRRAGGRGGGATGGATGVVRGWDRAFLIGRARAEECQLDAAAVAAYFPLDRVLKGVSLLVGRVLGVSLAEVEMSPGENWCAGVRKLRVSSEGGEDIGTVYLDLSPRPHKFPHAAHFVIRCGRRRNRAGEGNGRQGLTLVHLIRLN